MILNKFHVVWPIPKEKKEYDFLVITTTKAFKEHQLRSILNTIESLREAGKQEKLLNHDDVLMDYVLPETIILIFSDKHKLTRENAITVMHTQASSYKCKPMKFQPLS